MSAEKWVDPDKYGYMDVVYDKYNSVLDHVKEEKNITFSVSCVPPEGKLDIPIKSNTDVVNMLASSPEEYFLKLIAFDVQVSQEYSKDYTVNGYPPSIASRDGKSGIQSSKVPKWIAPTVKYIGHLRWLLEGVDFHRYKGQGGLPEIGQGEQGIFPEIGQGEQG
ncbi:hypothetical protein NE237_010148 [Protea cynaroides]|uniref:Uncharacterized protein n=1 Tax=Protea cynaroides TaxID=273540 RepID=A0A9Q0KZ10_9MAGN|nr:hypothetical protein NE237_010148 [Protea cynaroides]